MSKKKVFDIVMAVLAALAMVAKAFQSGFALDSRNEEED